MPPPEIVLVGERNLSFQGHAGIEASLAIHRHETESALSCRWVPTMDVAAHGPAATLGSASGIWCVPGSPYASTAGALSAIRYAREQKRVFLGTCGGFQHALMEFHQNVLGCRAAHQEMEPDASNPLIARLSCSLAETTARVRAVSGSGFGELLGGEESTEGFNCNYGLAPAFESAFAGSGLEFVAHDEAGLVRAFRLRTHPFFVGTLFQPERRALGGTLHSLVRRFFAQAAIRIMT